MDWDNDGRPELLECFCTHHMARDPLHTTAPIKHVVLGWGLRLMNKCSTTPVLEEMLRGRKAFNITPLESILDSGSLLGVMRRAARVFGISYTEL